MADILERKRNAYTVSDLTIFRGAAIGNAGTRSRRLADEAIEIRPPEVGRGLS